MRYALLVALPGLILAAPSAPTANPLVALKDPIAWDRIKAEHVKPAITQLLREAEAKRKVMVETKATPTWATTLGALDGMMFRLNTAFGLVAHLEGTATSPALRAAFNEMLPAVSEFVSSIGLDARIASRLKAYTATPEGKALIPVRARALKLALDDFRRSGVDLPADRKKRMSEINRELDMLQAKFGQNALDSTNEFEVIVADEKELSGLPESARNAARESAKNKSKAGWRFTLEEPSLTPVMQYADNGALREKMFRGRAAVARSGKFDNRPLIERILALRREKAKLLGYANYADLVTEDRMAKNGANVRKFLGDLEDKSRPFFEKEASELVAFRKSVDGQSAPPVQAWDTSYYGEKMKKRLFSFEEEKLRPWFPLPATRDGMFLLATRLFGVRIAPAKGIPVWDPAVETYNILDADGKTLAVFYIDLFPRENKQQGAWMNPLLIRGAVDGKPHVGSIACNFNKPAEGKPALLTHYEVTTLFHEFGHLLHLALSNVPVRGLAATNVAWDFVELPSQIMENFTWERPVLDTFAKHHETGEKISDSDFAALTKVRQFRAANAMMRQLSFATLDIDLHTDYTADDKQRDPLTYSYEIQKRFQATPPDPSLNSLTTFGHVFGGGYAAGYYSYKWAEVLDADAYNKFKSNGIFSRETGEQFRRAILEKGNSEDAATLYRNFMGRDPDVRPLLERSGLVSAK